MKKRTGCFMTGLLVILMLAGCANDENIPEVTVSPQFTATIGSVQSRAFDNEWEAGDEIGITGVNRRNVCYHTADASGTFSVKNTGDQIYFEDENDQTFIAYYPWNNLAGEAVTINADTREQSRQKNFDFLWAQASGKKDRPNVTFAFAHKMAKVVLTVKPGHDMSYEEIKTCRLSLEGFRYSGSFNIADGSTSTTVDDASKAWTFSDFAKFNDSERTMTFSLIFFPQMLNKPLDFFAELNSGSNNTLSLRAAIDFTAANREKDGTDAKNEWVAGRQYNLSVTFNKTDITLNKCVINSWNEVMGEEIIVD